MPTSSTTHQDQQQHAATYVASKTRRFARALGKALTTSIYGALSVSFMLLLIEGFLALNHIGEQEYLKVDPVTGFAHLENKLVTDRSEALGIDKINSAGLCDTEHSVTRTPGTVRIAILGDSITEALQLPIKERFARVLETKLNATSAQKFEVINFGVGGFGTGQEYLQFIKDVRRYKPDQVILMYHQGDETENSPDGSKWSLQPTFTLSAANAPQIRYQEFDTWRESPSSAPLTFFEWGRRNSHIWQCLSQTHSTLKNEPLYKRITDLLAKLSKGFEKILVAVNPHYKQSIAAQSIIEKQNIDLKRQELLQQAQIQSDLQPSPACYDADRQWLLTVKLIDMLNQQCHRDKVKLLIVFVPAMEKPVNMRPDFTQKIAQLKKLGAEKDFETVDLSPNFYAAEKETTRPIILLAHLSPHGHKLVASEIASYLDKQESRP
jgi:lysophospholipase L1-like esterase